MSTEAKTRISETVTQIKQEVFKLTGENLVLNNCWQKEQAENEELRRRVRALTAENAVLRHENNSLQSQIHLLEQNMQQNMRTPHEIAHPVRRFERRVHNLEPKTIFKGNSPTR